MSKIALALLAEDRRVIVYRPQMNAATRSVAATLFLQQVFYHWNYKKEPFFKFFAPNNHKLYREGDSFMEELGFS